MLHRRFSARLLLHNLSLTFKRLSIVKKLMLCILIIAITALISRSHPWRTFPISVGSLGSVTSSRVFRRPPTIQSASTWRKRKGKVKDAFLHAYRAYELTAFGKDELRPWTNDPINNLNGWGLTIVDSLDTMLLMGLDEEFDRAMDFVETLNFHEHHGEYIGFFETTIRYLGGFLGAYYIASNSTNELHRETYAPVLLRKADELGEVLSAAFNPESGVPFGWVSAKTGKMKVDEKRRDIALAEMASCQMEFKYLSHLTQNPDYFIKSDKVMDLMEQQQGKTPKPVWMTNSQGKTVEQVSSDHGDNTGLWTNHWYVEDGKMFGSVMSAGSLGDSAYEYLLKQYLLSGRSEERLLTMYFKAMDGIFENLLYLSTKRNLLYVAEVNSWGTTTGRMDHLSCYLPGVLALGARLLDPDYQWSGTRATSRIRPRSPVPAPVPNTNADDIKAKLDLHMRAAVGLAYTCWIMYDDMDSGIGAEVVHFNPPVAPEGTLTKYIFESRRWAPKMKEWRRRGKIGPLIGTEDWPKARPKNPEFTARNTHYLLRPEAIEAMYLLWKTTGDPIWRERGWRMFEAIEKHTKHEHGYTTLQYVHTSEPAHLNEMPSFFLAETLKYAHLLTFEESDDPLPLDQMVFSTEAHPFPMFHWTEEEKIRYGIRT